MGELYTIAGLFGPRHKTINLKGLSSFQDYSDIDLDIDQDDETDDLILDEEDESNVPTESVEELSLVSPSALPHHKRLLAKGEIGKGAFIPQTCAPTIGTNSI